MTALLAGVLPLLLACTGSTEPGGPDEAQVPSAPVASTTTGPTTPPSADWPDAPDGPRVEAVVDLTNPASGEMKVRLHYTGLLPEMWGLKQMGKQSEVAVDDISLKDGSGGSVRFDTKGREIRLKGKEQSELVVEYTVKPGGDGRHGHQGLIAPTWSTFDGRIFLLPDNAAELRGGRLRFEAPEGWIAGGPLREGDDGWLYADNYGGDMVASSLGTACFGVGPQERHVEKVDGVEVRVFTPLTSSAGDRARINRENVAIMRWFTQQLGFRPDFPMAWVWTEFQDGKRVYGGSAAHGTCMEQPKSRTRAWELMAHRVAHSMNKYPPSGLHIKDDRDHWFMEGWPSYVELAATVGSGVRKDAPRWNTLYQRYRTVRDEEPALDTSMALEPTCKGEGCEYMHYYKGPVVVKMLDDFIARHHEGKSLTEFMKVAYARHGGFQSDLDLRVALDEYLGASMGPWWATFVDQRAWLFPVWPEAISGKLTSAAARPGAATVGGRPVSGDYLFLLASSGEFGTYQDIVDFLLNEEARRAQLEAAGIVLFPPELEPLRAGLDPETRFDLARAEAAWPLYPQYPSPEGVELSWNESDPDARTFLTLLEHERKLAQTASGSGLEKLRLFVADDKGEFGDTPVLAFGGGVKTRFVTNWHWAPEVGTVKIGRDGAFVEERELTTQPDWTMWRTVQSPDERPKGDGPVTFEIHGVSDQPLVRSYWQRGK